MKQRFFIVLILFSAISLSVYCQFPEVDKITLIDSNLNNFYRLDEGVYRSEQPGKKDFKILEKFGIKETLNLRRWHSDDDEAEETSIILHRLKTNAHSISEEQLVEALRIIKDRKGPILIHCKHGSDRTGGVIALYRVIFQDVPKDIAVMEMKEGDFGFHRIYRNIVRVIMNADVERIKKELGL